ncbi:class I SAM-dependent methyltransferase [Sediminibacterium goheungense]|uniref:2-polyprenyl-6-hydroxyphenyl methylase/3-demethylubiquinone-9 3-methyltransferase n=1 Tax=Sediminibacterium goheungense TaxID=1086393 RepID=A0A4R6ITK1_9BACT|nr:class I SAM-dependent methyltransferase [Sediminibacterium goheungense]TDO25862.1 2-polyprenyl-6-hydroxyphenyl methylase/3-demethylubiquinone-9 3-methyltransferase [Sediminibacterium goheungense]
MKKNIKWQLAQKLEYAWWKRYLRKKDPTAYLQYKKAYWLRMLDTLQDSCQLADHETILDAGCGPAGIFMALEKHAVVALDPLLDLYNNLPHFNKKAYPWTSFVQTPLELLTDAEKYDRIFCMNAINHVNDIKTCYHRLFDALKSGGTLILSTDAHRFFLLKKIFQWLPGDMLHPVQLSIQEYEQLLRDTGFQLQKSILFKNAGIFNYYILIAKKF